MFSVSIRWFTVPVVRLLWSQGVLWDGRNRRCHNRLAVHIVRNVLGYGHGDDGVFGSQRGFKNAGVHTLLMSLKNVYDDSTAELMIRFYEYLMNGETKREALVNAQHDFRVIASPMLKLTSSAYLYLIHPCGTCHRQYNRN